MSLNMRFAGKSYRKGDEIWINIGWNTRGNQIFMKIPPDSLANRVEKEAYTNMFTDMEQGLDGVGGHCPAIVQCCPLLAIPILPCYCAHLLYEKNKFDGILDDVIQRHKGNFNNAIKWQMVQTGQQRDPYAALGYNIIFDLNQLPEKAGGGSAPVTVGSAPPPAYGDDATAKLHKIKELYDKGILTEEEYNAKKAKLMEEI